MATVIVERTYAEPVTEAEVQHAIDGPQPCYDMRRVKHVRSLLSADGRHLLCVYDAPDAASVRQALQEQGDSYVRAWAAVEIFKQRT